MANDVLKLTWAADGEADEAEFNLLDFLQGLTLDEGGWVPQVAVGDQATVTETMTFHAKAMSHDQLAGYVQVLDDWIIKVGWSQDFTQRQFVWLNARWKSETEIRRAVVYSLSYALGGNDSSPFGVYLRDDSFVPTLTIVITRAAFWEPTNLTTIGSLIGIDTTGGMGYLKNPGGTDYIAVGDVPSRFGYLQFDFSSNLRYAWIGFRSSRNGVLANFQSVWALVLASYLLGTSSDTTITADATAYNGVNKIRTTFAAGASLTTRIRITANDVTASEVDQRGTYICLMRAKMSDASIARVRISGGFGSGAFANPYYTNPRVTIQGTSWLLYEMGLLRLPSMQRENSTDLFVMSQAGVIIDAERVSGSGSLDMDILILVPYNDAYLNLDVGHDSASAKVMTHPDYTYSVFDPLTIQQANVQSTGWGLPANNEMPLCVIAAQTATAHALGLTAILGAKIAKRWRTLRGTE